MTDPRPTLLVVEDEPEIRRFLRAAFGVEGYRVVESTAGRRGAIDAGTHKPDLAIIDLGLPDVDGIEVIRSIRKWSPMPIIVLSARLQERSKIEALDAGADDYVTKPFGVNELLARVRAALRHAVRTGSGTPILRFGNAVVDLEKRTANRGAEKVHLTPIEFRLLTSLAAHLGMVVSPPPASDRGMGSDPRKRHALLTDLYEAIAGQARDRPGETTSSADGDGSRLSLSDGGVTLVRLLASSHVPIGRVPARPCHHPRSDCRM